MEHVREALLKAHASLDEQEHPVIGVAPLVNSIAPPARPVEPPPVLPKWTPPKVELNPRHLRRNRVVSYEMSDPSHVPFNLLRTKVRTAMSEHDWRSVGITSPTPHCGKTLIAVNLALSLARGADVKTVLIDLDLKRPSVARTMGIEKQGTVGKFLLGKGEAKDCFVQVGSGLVVGLNGGHLMESSELLQGPRMAELLDFVKQTLAPDAIVFDLPPMGGGDDALAFLPRLDTVLLVAAAGQTTVAQIDECEQQLVEREKFFGLVLNKAEAAGRDYYY